MQTTTGIGQVIIAIIVIWAIRQILVRLYYVPQNENSLQSEYLKTRDKLFVDALHLDENGYENFLKELEFFKSKYEFKIDFAIKNYFHIKDIASRQLKKPQSILPVNDY